ncbi:SprT-like domain-containing protein [Halobacillus amylolyticus]|uniref:SprT-like domain-containing protein n=1 Tax=Halobacillus amylolyticus TaxID=2932259 RepID=A0ABY4HH34_9BACI|nr:SprT-like domain-containing protein [Halobacillus amylolyticus]UOR14198.1 SprT-like domain-containing protein [Halobacillus amylolyticus]
MPEIHEVNIDQITQELHNAFYLFNQHYFNNELPTPAITIQSSGHKRKSMGWCTVVPVWGDKEGKTKMYEINLSAEFLDLDFYETMDTLLHEMVHLYHKVHNIQDCSRKGTYHNKHFKKKVLEIGFEYQNDKPDAKHGWTYARLGQKVKDEISNMNISADVFTISRRGSIYFNALENGQSAGEAEMQSGRETSSAGKPSSYKWVCSGCGLIMRSSKKEVNVKCGDCDITLEKQ